jgi:hypothetical protein
MMDGNGNVVVPRWLFIYYKTSVAKPDVRQSEVFPEGLGFVSKGVGSSPDIDYWCGPVTENVNHAIHKQTIPSCNGRMTQRVKFPFCWDGRLNSKDNSHMVMPIGRYEASICPDTHPRRIPHIEYQLEYTVPGNSGSWHLSSDVSPTTNQLSAARGSTAHGDWMNGWNPTLNKLWNDNCTKKNLDCTQNVFLPDKTRLQFHNKARFNGVGSNIISAADINKLCPGDQDSGRYDGAYCQTALQRGVNSGLSQSSVFHEHTDGEDGHLHDENTDRSKNVEPDATSSSSDDIFAAQELRYGGDDPQNAPEELFCSESLVTIGVEEFCKVELTNSEL